MIGDQALSVSAIAVFAALMGGYLSYTLVKDFGVEDKPNQPPEVQRDRR